MKKTKIICTIGPSSESREVLKDMMLAGMDAARMNFSHGSHEEHKKKMDLVKELREELGIPVPLILDTKGPEIRTGTFTDKSVELTDGQEFIITTESMPGTNAICSVSYGNLVNDVVPGDQLLIDDGLVGLVINKVDGSKIYCTVENGGTISNYKSVNLPGVKVKLPAVTEKDKEDIRFGIQEDVDFIAASFVRKASDVEEMRAFLDQHGGEDVQIIAKIENKEGVDNIEEIIAAADAVMVARGDLGVEIPAEQVPLIQKRIIHLCNLEGKPVITATQMLDSMMRNPRPTRAEVTDVANAIFDGTDAIMLSGESASGKYPLEAVNQMVQIACAIEDSLNYDKLLREKGQIRHTSITNAIGHATCNSACGLKATAILTPTETGYTALVVAKFRPKAPIIAFSSSCKVVRQLSLAWGVTPLTAGPSHTAQDVFEQAVHLAKKHGFIKDSDLVVITTGVPVGKEGNTNMLRIHVVGSPL